MLRKKNITLNGKKAAGNEILALGDNVKLFFSDETIKKFSKTSEEVFRPVQKNTAKSKVKLNVLYEDENVIFLNKKISNVSKDRIVVGSKNFHAVIVECYVVQCPDK